MIYNLVLSPAHRLLIRQAVLALIVLSIFGLGYLVRGFIAGKQIADIKLDHQEEKAVALKEHTDALQELVKQNQELQQKVDDLGIQHTKVLNEKLAENSTLRSDLNVARRMRLTGSVCPKAPAKAGDSSTGSLGDGTPVELSESTRLAVWDLREALIRDTAKVTYLQDYIRTSCR